MMTSELWHISIEAIQSMGEAPSWLKQQAHLRFEDAICLPAVDVADEGADVMPTAEERLLKADYLDFLREQISLEPRGLSGATS